MNDQPQPKTSRALIAFIVVLLAIVAAQSVLLFRMSPPSAAAGETPERDSPPPFVQAQPDPTPPAPQQPQVAPYDPWSQFPTGGWDPFSELEQMRQDMDRLFNDSFGRFHSHGFGPDALAGMSFAPSLDLREEKDRYLVRMDIPGAEKSDIQVELDDRLLTISGTTEETVEENDGRRVLRKERRSGQFQRSITLPGPADAEKMEARYEDGVLTVTVPKRSAPRASRSVKVI